MSTCLSFSRRSPSAVAGVLLFGFGLVFFLPYHVAVAPAISDAYVFGFNNRAALLIFIAFVAAFARWSGGLGLVARLPQDAEVQPPLSRRWLSVTLALTALITLSFWAAFRSVGAINEGAYLMDRLQHLAAGEILYRQFEFIYGPTMLLLPLLLHRTLGLSLTDAYYLAWVLAWLVGVALLWLTVAWTAATSPRKNGIYLLAWIGFIFSTVSLGLNYTPLRFIAAPFFAALTWRMLERRRSLPLAVATALAGGGWVLFYSPEQGIAFLLGTLAFFLLFVRRSRPGYLVSVAFLIVGECLLLFALAHTGLLRYVQGMAAGGYNLPLLPSLYTLFLLGLLLMAGCILVNTLRLQRLGGPVEYLILIAGFALPAAFGRADPGHLFMNTVGAFLAAWTVISYRLGAGRWMVWFYVASVLFLPLALYQANNFFMYPIKTALLSPSDPHPGLRRWTLHWMQQAAGPARTDAMLSKWRAAYPLVQPTDIPPGRTLLAPLGYASGLLLPGLPPISNGRYRGLGNVMTAGEVQEKVEELRMHPQDLLLFTADASCPSPAQLSTPPDMAAFDRAARRELWMNLQPLYLPHVRHVDTPLQPVCAYIDSHYRLTRYTGPLVGSQIWMRVPGS